MSFGDFLLIFLTTNFKILSLEFAQCCFFAIGHHSQNNLKWMYESSDSFSFFLSFFHHNQTKKKKKKQNKAKKQYHVFLPIISILIHFTQCGIISQFPLIYSNCAKFGLTLTETRNNTCDFKTFTKRLKTQNKKIYSNITHILYILLHYYFYQPIQ